MTDIIDFKTRAKTVGAKEEAVSPDSILGEAKGKLEDVLILGIEKETGGLYISSNMSYAMAIFVMEAAKLDLLNDE